MQTDPYLGAIRWVANVDGTLAGPSAAGAQGRGAAASCRDHRKAFGLTLRDLALLRFRRDYVDIHRHAPPVVGADPGQPSPLRRGPEGRVAADGSLVTLAGPSTTWCGSRTAPTSHALRAGGARRSPRAAGVSAGARPGSAEAAGARRAGPVPHRRRDPRLGVGDDHRPLTPARRPLGDRCPHRRGPVAGEPGARRTRWATRPGLAARARAVPERRRRPGPVTFPVAGPDALSGNNAHVYTAEDGDDDDRPRRRDPGPRRRRPVLGPGRRRSTPRRRHRTAAPRSRAPGIPASPYSWQANRRQEAVQAYYLLNVFHDHLAAAPIGFTEAAGNFQVTNDDGEGGRGGDPVNAATLVGADLRGNGKPALLNNSTMYTPPDGRPGRMSLYLFRTDATRTAMCRPPTAPATPRSSSTSTRTDSRPPRDDARRERGAVRSAVGRVERRLERLVRPGRARRGRLPGRHRRGRRPDGRVGQRGRGRPVPVRRLPGGRRGAPAAPTRRAAPAPAG